MDKKEQINEIAKDICCVYICGLEDSIRCKSKDGSCYKCQHIAEKLINRDWRKKRVKSKKLYQKT